MAQKYVDYHSMRRRWSKEKLQIPTRIEQEEGSLRAESHNWFPLWMPQFVVKASTLKYTFKDRRQILQCFLWPSFPPRSLKVQKGRDGKETWLACISPPQCCRVWDSGGAFSYKFLYCHESKERLYSLGGIWVDSKLHIYYIWTDWARGKVFFKRFTQRSDFTRSAVSSKLSN